MEIKEFVIHSALNGRYKIQFEQSAVKGVLGFKIEANGDDLAEVQKEANILLEAAKNKATNFYPVQEVVK